jgi:hypothetical protein
VARATTGAMSFATGRLVVTGLSLIERGGYRVDGAVAQHSLTAYGCEVVVLDGTDVGVVGTVEGIVVGTDVVDVVVLVVVVLVVVVDCQLSYEIRSAL